MTPHEFCHWLLGYVTAQPNAVNDDVRCALSRVDMTSFFIPPIPDADQSPPANPSVRGYYGTVNGYPIPAPVIQTPLN